MQSGHRPDQSDLTVQLTLETVVHADEESSHLTNIPYWHKLDPVAVRDDLETLAGSDPQRLAHGLGDDHLELRGYLYVRHRAYHRSGTSDNVQGLSRDDDGYHTDNGCGEPRPRQFQDCGDIG